MAYKLSYFNITGLGEPIRFMLSYGNIDFEDNRVKHEDWPELKKTMPMGQMPILEIDGKTLHQHVSICRLLAKKVGLDGKTDMENFDIDSVADTVNDLRQKIIPVHFEQDPTAKEAKLKTLMDETLPFYLNALEEIAKANNGHLALKRLTWADLYFTAWTGALSFIIKQDITANHPNLKKVAETVLALDNIKKWIAKRPKTDF